MRTREPISAMGLWKTYLPATWARYPPRALETSLDREKNSSPNKQILEECLDFARILLKEDDIVREPLNLMHRHAPS